MFSDLYHERNRCRNRNNKWKGFAEKGKQEIADGAVRMMLPALVYAAEKDQTDTPSKDLAWAVMRWLWPAGAFMTEQGKEETAGEDSRTYAMILEKTGK